MPAPGARMTDRSRCFETSWDRLRPQLESYLRSRGVERHLAEDVIQDTAVKLLTNWHRVGLDRPLWPLVRTVAFNCLADNRRSWSPLPIGELPEAPAPYDLEEHGLARARLSRVRTTLDRLSEADRSVLLGEVGSLPRPADTSATKMARLRARRRLTEAMNRAAAAFGLAPLGWRRFGLWLQSSDLGPILPAVAGTATALSLAALSILPVQQPDLTGDGERRLRPGAFNLQSEVREPPVALPGKKRHIRASAAEEPVAETLDRSGETSEPRPTDPQETSAGAGPARAQTGGDENGKYAGVCTGQNTPDEDDDKGIYVGYGHSDPDEEKEDEPPEDPC